MREDKIISALIGLVGACSNNPKTDDTDSLVIKALAFSLICPEYDDKMVQEIINDIYREKYSVAPGCAQCTAPCGNTSDYDMSRIYEASEEIRKVKQAILEKLQKAAADIYRSQRCGLFPQVDYDFFYKALSYVSYDVDKAVLLGVLEEAKELEDSVRKKLMSRKENHYVQKH